jgi:hypothetical protein
MLQKDYNEITGHESEVACRQDELIGGKQL